MFLVRLLAAVAFVAPLAACGPSVVATGAAAPAALHAPFLRPAGTAALLGSRSWLRAKRSHEALLYVSDDTGVTIYSNVSGTYQLAGELFGLKSPAGECVDKSGDVFIVDFGAPVIYEYAPGTVTPKAVIADPLGQPYSCAIDRKTGALAVTNLTNPSGGEPGNVIVYPSPAGTPVEYADSHLNEPLFCAFDAKGDLYVDAYDTSFHAVLSELVKGASTLSILTLSGHTWNIPTGLQSDGSDLLIGDVLDPKTQVLDVTVSGSTATFVRSIALSNTEALSEFSLTGSGSNATLIAPDYDNSNIEFYTFPGGSLTGSLTAGIHLPFGAVLTQT